MPEIKVIATEEQLKAVNGIVVDAQEWLQAAWDGKANACIKRVIENESNLNPLKLSDAERAEWIKTNTFETRKQRDIRMRL